MSCSIEICSFYKNICPGILFKIALCVILSFGLNLFQQKSLIDVPSSKRSAGRLVKVLFYILEACERDFHALSKYANFIKICVPEYRLRFRLAHSLFWHKSFSTNKFFD